MDTFPLRARLESINPLNDQGWAAVEGLVSIRAVSAGEHLLRAGEQARQVFFLQQGLLREYYLDHAGQESTRRFCIEGQFSGSLADLISGAPAPVFIESLLPGEVWMIDWRSLDLAAEQHPCLMKLLRRFAEGLYVQKMLREFEMLTLPAAERYQRFARQHPELNSSLPRHMIASYLGISPVHLSRIGAEKRQPSQSRPTERK